MAQQPGPRAAAPTVSGCTAALTATGIYDDRGAVGRVPTRTDFAALAAYDPTVGAVWQLYQSGQLTYEQMLAVLAAALLRKNAALEDVAIDALRSFMPLCVAMPGLPGLAAPPPDLPPLPLASG